MRYWWVNQNQTFRQEFAGGYLWSPKRNANDVRNPFYETMREVSPGVSDARFNLRDAQFNGRPPRIRLYCVPLTSRETLVNLIASVPLSRRQ
jgi:hypothetical protein